MQDYIDRNSARASTAGMANSRKKMLDRIERMAKPVTERDCSFKFPYIDLNTKDMLIVKSLKVGYDFQLIPDVSFHLGSTSKIWIRGTNGVGKTTLLKTLMRKIPSLGGSFNFHPAAKIGYIEQELGFENGNLSAYNVYLNAFPRCSQKEVRSALATVGLAGELAPCRELAADLFAIRLFCFCVEYYIAKSFGKIGFVRDENKSALVIHKGFP